MSGSETLNNELTNTLGYLIDKFNLTLELSTEQIKTFSIQLADKIIRWEVMTSLLNMIAIALMIVLITIILKRFKIAKFSVLSTEYDELIKLTDAESMRKYNILLMKIAIRIVYYFLIGVFTIMVLSEITDIVLSIAFPEKIILEFMGKYL